MQCYTPLLGTKQVLLSLQEKAAVSVVDFPPPKPLIQLLTEAWSNQAGGFGRMTAAAQIAEAQSASSAGSLFAPLIWLVLAKQQGIQANAIGPGAVDAVAHATVGMQGLHGDSLLTGSIHRNPVTGLQMLYHPGHIQ